MRILLDECLTKKTKRNLKEFEVSTVTEAGLSGLKNGKLLKAAVEMNFEILLTIDKNMGYQQNVGGFPIAVVILDATRSHVSYIEPLIPTFKKQLSFYRPGTPI
jgi:predicted nuclease of predicted toxin-antitoxin system